VPGAKPANENNLTAWTSYDTLAQPIGLLL